MFSNNVQDNMVGNNILSNNRREIILFNMLHQKSFCNFLMKKKKSEDDISLMTINSLSLADSGENNIDRINIQNTGVIQSIRHNYSTESIINTCGHKQQLKDTASYPIRYFQNTYKINGFGQLQNTPLEEAMKQGVQAWGNEFDAKREEMTFLN